MTPPFHFPERAPVRATSPRARALTVGLVVAVLTGPAAALADAPDRFDPSVPSPLPPEPQQAVLGPEAERPLRPVARSTTPACGTFGCARAHAHNGLDMTAPHGTRISAPLTGRVALVAREGAGGPAAGYGNFVCLQHRSRLATCFAHLSRFAERVVVGSVVRRGEKLGEVGSTGASTGDHLHFEVRRGAASCQACAVDPAPWLRSEVEPGPLPG